MTDRAITMTEAFSCARRELLLGAGAGGVALLAACGGSSKGGAAGTSTGTGSGSSSAGSSQEIVALAEVPSDTAVSVKDPTGRILLITQNGGKLTALDSTCTHRSCTVAPDGAKLLCPCHGSQYTLTGAVIQGPAPAALHPVAVKVTAGQVVLV